MTSEVVLKLLPLNRQLQLLTSWRRPQYACIFHLLGAEWNVPFWVTKPVVELSVSKHRQTTRPAFGAQSSTKPSTKLRGYFLGEIRNPCLCAETKEDMRGTTNFLGMTTWNSTSVCYCCSIHWCDEVLTYIFRCSKDPSQHQMAKNVVYTILNGSVEEVTQHLGRCSTVWNGQTVPVCTIICKCQVLSITSAR